jgi:hypothetical protein
VRFTCGSCGRAYVADDRIEGLAFKMPCRRCGQIISVEGGPFPTPGAGGPAGSGAAGPDNDLHPVADPAPATEHRPVAGLEPAPAAALAAAPAADGTTPAAGKGRLAPLLVVGVVLLAAAGGVVWTLGAPARSGAPPRAEPPREAAIVPPAVAPSPGSTPAPAAWTPVEPPARPAEPAVPVPASSPGPLAVVPPAGAAPKAERTDGRKRAPAPVAAARSAADPASSSLAGPGPAAIPAASPRTDLPPRDEQQTQATLATYAGSFDGCVAEARRDEPDLLASPRPVVVTMTVHPSGKVLYPTLDDAELSGTALGACVKKQSARMLFPESGGEPVRVRMPLLLGG